MHKIMPAYFPFNSSDEQLKKKKINKSIIKDHISFFEKGFITSTHPLQKINNKNKKIKR